MTKKHIGFAPITGEGKYLFSVCESWGAVEFANTEHTISVFGNPLILHSLSIPDYESITKITVDGKEIDFEIGDGKLMFEEVKICGEMSLK